MLFLLPDPRERDDAGRHPKQVEQLGRNRQVLQGPAHPVGVGDHTGRRTNEDVDLRSIECLGELMPVRLACINERTSRPEPLGHTRLR